MDLDVVDAGGNLGIFVGCGIDLTFANRPSDRVGNVRKAMIGHLPERLDRACI